MQWLDALPVERGTDYVGLFGNQIPLQMETPKWRHLRS